MCLKDFRVTASRSADRRSADVPRRRGGRRGGVMVEASIYFPLAIFVAMAVLMLMIYAYHQTCAQANLHIQVRAAVMRDKGTGSAKIEDGRKRDMYRRNAEKAMSQVVRHKEKGLFGTTYYDITVNGQYKGNQTISLGGRRTEFYARAYALDEAKLVRLRHLGAAALKGG